MIDAAFGQGEDLLGRICGAGIDHIGRPQFDRQFAFFRNGVSGNDPARIPFDFPEPALAPRPVFINAPLHDSNFDVSGVRDCVATAQPIYERLFKAGDHLVAHYPDVGHEFPEAMRQAAYAFLDRWLRA